MTGYKISPPIKNVHSNIFYRVLKYVWHGVTWYCDRTSLHGFHYITHNSSSILTRIFFALVSCCSIILCSYLIMLQLFEHQQQSIMTTVTSTAYPVWKIRFPSVTICNFNVVYKKNIQNVTDEVKEFGVSEPIFMDILYNLSSLVIYDDVDNMTGYKEVYDLLQKNYYDTGHMMAKLAHPCENMLKICYWQTEEVECMKIFKAIKTSQGYCCSFNYYATKKYLQTENTTTYQYQYVGGAGPKLGLRLYLDAEEAQYVSSMRPTYGFNILVQDGQDYPDMSLIGNTLLPAEELTISVTPQVYLASENIRSVKPEDRHCLFKDEVCFVAKTSEGNLKWTSIYSYKTCISECKANAIYQLCYCIPFYYPRIDNVRICTLLDVPCLQKNSRNYNALALSEKLLTEDDFVKLSGRIGRLVQCNCYPPCNERKFNLLTDRAKAIPMIGYEYTNMSILNVYFNTVGCIKTERNVYYTWDRVLAAIGGIFGLCLGGSVISILECFYFLGRCSPDFNKTKPEPIKPTGYYPKDFLHHHRRPYYIKKSYSPPGQIFVN